MTISAHDNLMKFGAYPKALKLFDFVVADLACLRPHRECVELAANVSPRRSRSDVRGSPP